jgi:hypothetical protein
LNVTRVRKPYDVPFLLAQVEQAWHRLMGQA